MSDSHIIKLPLWVWILKLVQGVFSILLLGLSAYGVHYADDFIDYRDWVSPEDAYGFTLFTVIFTWIVLAYYFLSTTLFKFAYSWIAVLVLECFAVLFWLVSASVLGTMHNDYFDNDNHWKRYIDMKTYDTYKDVVPAAIAFSVLQFILFIITLVVLSIGIHRHRKAGGPMSSGAFTTGEGAEKHEVSNLPPAANTAAPTTEQHQQYPPPQQYQQPATYDQQSYSSNVSPYQPSASPAQTNTYEAPASEVSRA